VSEVVGLDPDQVSASAHELGVALSRLGDVSDDLTMSEVVADIRDVTGAARGLLGELQHEVLLTSALLLDRAELMELADRVVSTSGAGLQLGVRVAGYTVALSAALADDSGSDGHGDEVRRHLERRTWKLAGLDDVPCTVDHVEVDAHYQRLLASLRPSEKMQLRSAMYQRFGSAVAGGEPGHLAVATVIATLIIDARVPRSAGRYWTALSADERQQYITSASEELLATFAASGVVSPGELDAFDSHNAYAVFSDELKVALELEVDVKYVTVELGANLVAKFIKMSDGGVQVELGAGAKAGVGVDWEVAEASVGLYMDTLYTLRFDDEGSAAAALAQLREAIDADTPDGIGEAIGDFLFGGMPETPVVVMSLWAEHGERRMTEAGGYGRVEGALDEVGLLQLDGEFQVQLGGYAIDDRKGDAVEDGVLFRVEGGIDGDGATPGSAISRGDLTVRALATPTDEQLEIQLSGTVVAGADGSIDATSSGPVATVLQRLGVETSALVAQGMRSTVTIRLPLSAATAAAAKKALVDGDVEGFDELYESADVEVIGERVELEQVDGEIDVAIAEAALTVERIRATTIEVYRKAPYGEPYSPIDVDRAIEVGRASG
jgi:hypothetical protein